MTDLVQASTLLGLGLALLWVCGGVVVALLATDYVQELNGAMLDLRHVGEVLHHELLPAVAS